MRELLYTGTATGLLLVLIPFIAATQKKKIRYKIKRKRERVNSLEAPLLSL